MTDYSDALVLVWHVAALEAGALGHTMIEPGHFFVALCKVCDIPLDRLAVNEPGAMEDYRRGVIESEIEQLRQVFFSVKLDPTRFRRRLRAEVTSNGRGAGDGIIHRSPGSRELFARAENLCMTHADRTVRPMHVLWALVESENGPWARVLDEMQVDLQALLQVVENAPEPDDGVAQAGQPGNDAMPRKCRTPFLDAFGRDITKLACEGKLAPVIGRKDEIRRMAQILLQARRNNVILVGEAGVGKTCVVEGFAQRITAEECHEDLRSKRIVEISLNSLVAGTKYRGEFEERLQSLLSEASGNPDIILFIDEVHSLVGAGAASGSMDAAAIMKPALARGDIRCIGATTTAEYRQSIEKDQALARRFQIVWVEEPTREEALEILRGLRPWLEEEHHGLKISDEALAAAVDLSARYIKDQRLPDKAVEIVDEACAQARLKTITRMEDGGEIGRADIANVVSIRARVPVDRLTGDKAALLRDMEKLLRGRVKGQEEAISQLSETIRAAYAGLTEPNRPQGVFLFLGPTGTGKTELAKALAELLYDDEENLIRFDMSEYAERHTIAKLIGAPPGYIRSEEEGELTSAIRTKPASVVLLDEIEKAHPDVHQLFLQVFDDGRLTDSHGRRASFNESIIIMTSNLGSQVVKRIGPSWDSEPDAAEAHEQQERIMESVRDAMRPEFINRIDKLVFFTPLSREVVRQIIDKILVGLRERLGSRSVALELDESAYDVLVSEGYNEEYGARHMQRAVQRLIVEPLSSQIVNGKLEKGSKVVVSASDGKISLTPAEA